MFSSFKTTSVVYQRSFTVLFCTTLPLAEHLNNTLFCCYYKSIRKKHLILLMFMRWLIRTTWRVWSTIHWSSAQYLNASSALSPGMPEVLFISLISRLFWGCCLKTMGFFGKLWSFTSYCALLTKPKMCESGSCAVCPVANVSLFTTRVFWESFWRAPRKVTRQVWHIFIPSQL